MTYFSDRKKHNVDKPLTESIDTNVWNGIAVLINSLIRNNNLAKDFPRQCQDGNGICGVDERSFYVSAKAVIPGFKLLPEYGMINPLTTNDNTLENFSWYEEPSGTETISILDEQFKYDVLDFIEFVYKHISDVQNGKYHDFFHHYELLFPTTTNSRILFASNVNEIFERNHVAFKLDVNGHIQRIIDENLRILLESRSKTKDESLNDLLKMASDKISNPRIEERKIALERLWDAFERIKSEKSPNNKAQSVLELLDIISKGNSDVKEILNTECNNLTAIGNKFQIRHYEVGKISVCESEHIDYLFYRLYSLLYLFLLNNNI